MPRQEGECQMIKRKKALAALLLAALLALSPAAVALAEELPAVEWVDWSALAEAYGIAPDAGGEAGEDEAAAVLADEPTAASEPAEEEAGVEPAGASMAANGEIETEPTAAPASGDGAAAEPAAGDDKVEADAGEATDANETDAEPATGASIAETPDGAEADDDPSGGDVEPTPTAESPAMQFIAINGDNAEAATPAADSPRDADETAGAPADAGKWFVTTSTVNLRVQPNRNSLSINTVPKGTPLYSLDQSTVDRNGMTWYRVRYSEVECWVSGDYVREQTQADPVE